MGLLFQDPDVQLFMPRVFDDVAFGPLNLGLDGEEVRRRMAEALRAVGMEGFAGRAPHRLNTGEPKRIVLATVLSMQPEILALDEPTSNNLAPRGRREFMELIRDLGATVIIATHDLGLVLELCERWLWTGASDCRRPRPEDPRRRRAHVRPRPQSPPIAKDAARPRIER